MFIKVFFFFAPQMSKSHLFLESWHFKFMVIVICQQVTRESINSFFSRVGVKKPLEMSIQIEKKSSS